MVDQSGQFQPRSLSRPRIAAARIREIVSLASRLRGSSPREAGDVARREVLKWLERRAGKLPPQAWLSEAFEFEIPGRHASVIVVANGNEQYWVARLDHPCDTVVGRVWSTEATVAVNSSEARIGVRLACFSHREDPPVSPNIPGFVRQLAERPGLHDLDFPLLERALIPGSIADLDRMVRLLQSAARTRPAFVVSSFEQDGALTTAIDADLLARKTLGIAHVFILPSDLSFALTDLVGKEFSVFGGAVRTYETGLSFDEDYPMRHPLALAASVEAWPGGPSRFEEFLITKAFEKNARRSGTTETVPSFSTVKRFSLEERQTALVVNTQGDSDLAALYEAEIKEIRLETERWEAEWANEAQRKDEAEQRILELKQRDAWQRSELDRLRDLLSASGKSSAIPIPDTLDDLMDWAAKAVVGRLVILPRAARAAKGSLFNNPLLVYEILLLLATEFRDSKRVGGKEFDDAFNNDLRDRHLVCTPPFGGARAGEFGDEYYVDWGGNRRYLDLHVKDKKVTYDPARCLRIYFFWDSDTEQVVVGHLPGHLTNRSS